MKLNFILKMAVSKEATPTEIFPRNPVCMLSTACIGSSCEGCGVEDLEGNFVAFLRCFGFGSALVLLMVLSKLSIASFRL